MKLSASVLLEHQSIQVNPTTQAELEQHWEGIQMLKQQVQSTGKNEDEICLINTAGADHAQ